MKSPIGSLLLGALLIVLAGCGSKAAPPRVKIPRVACPTGYLMPQQAAPAKPWNSAPSLKIKSSHSYTACIETSAGNIVVNLMPSAARLAVNAIVILANHHFYDGAKFDLRRQSSFISAGAVKSPRFSFVNHNQGTYFMPSTVFLGHTAKGRADLGRLFICTGFKCESLDGTKTKQHTGYTVVGFVANGMKVVNAVARQAAGGLRTLPEGNALSLTHPVRVKTIRVYIVNFPTSFPADNSGS